MTNFIKYQGKMMPVASVIKLKAEEKTAPKKAVTKKAKKEEE